MTKTFRQGIFLFFVSYFVFTGCSNHADVEPLRIYAASSLTTLIPQIADAYRINHPNVVFEFNFAASSILAKQIEHGVQADIFFSANQEWMDYLQKKKLLKPETRKGVFTNALVLIVPNPSSGNVTSVADLKSSVVAKIAIGDWSHVPAGMYAKAALDTLGLWGLVKQKCIPALDVRAALTYVERNEADCGIVYATDAQLSSKVKVAEILPKKSQPDIIYPVAIMQHSRTPQAADFIRFLQADPAKKIIAQNGFRMASKIAEQR